MSVAALNDHQHPKSLLCCPSCSLADQVRHLLFPVQHVQLALLAFQTLACAYLWFMCAKKKRGVVVTVQFHGTGVRTLVKITTTTDFQAAVDAARKKRFGV